jgi:hypothetical protein
MSNVNRRIRETRPIMVMIRVGTNGLLGFGNFPPARERLHNLAVAIVVSLRVLGSQLRG